MKKVILLLFLISSFSSFSQTAVEKPDSLPPIQKRHSPTAASIMSAVVPGLGQAYNKKYWKIPIVFAGMGLPIYFSIANNKNFHDYKTAYLQKIDTTYTGTELFPNESKESVLSKMETSRRLRDLSYVICGLFYMLNIIDATVDAHLYYFDVSDDLTFHVVPQIPFPNKKLAVPALQLTYSF